MKNLLISVPVARTVRYFIDTDLFDSILDYCKKNSIHIYLLHKQVTLSNFYLGYNNITELKYPDITKVSRIKNIIRGNVNAPVIIKRYSFYGIFIYWGNLIRDTIFEKIKKGIILPFILFIYFIPYFGKKIFQIAFHDKKYFDFVKSLHIDASILNLPDVYEERILAQICNELKIPVIIGSDGWDTYSMYGYVHKYSGAMVWGPEMAKHALELGISKEELIYTGMPHKNRIQYFINNTDSNLIRTRYGIKPYERVILIPCNRWYQTNNMEKNFIENLIKFIENNTETQYCIILRENPGGIPRKDDINYNIIYSNNSRIHIQKPTPYFSDGWKGSINNEIMKEVAELFSITDYLFSITSLFMLEAAAFNIPVALYDIKKEKYNVRYMTKSSFYKKLLNSGIPELQNFNDIPKIFGSMKDKKYLSDFVSLYNFYDENCTRKIFQLLELS